MEGPGGIRATAIASFAADFLLPEPFTASTMSTAARAMATHPKMPRAVHHRRPIIPGISDHLIEVGHEPSTLYELQCDLYPIPLLAVLGHGVAGIQVRRDQHGGVVTAQRR